MTLAAIRKAGELTQTELAEKLGKNQGNIARTESSKDMLYSTLLEYLAATGATDIALTANVGGTRVEVDLASVQLTSNSHSIGANYNFIWIIASKVS